MSSDQDKVNGLLMEIRVLEGTYNELSSRQGILERILIESRSALEAVSSLASSKPEEVLVPLGGGVLVRSIPPNSDRIFVNIGANVVVEKSREEATTFVESRVKEIEDSIVSILNQKNQIAERLEQDRNILQAMVGQGQSE
jgi:prefoldin alpha subunit